MAQILEKRKFKRVRFAGKIRVFPIVSSDTDNVYQVQTSSFESQAHDIGEGGLGLKLAKDLKGSTLLKLLFEAANGRPVEVYGKVAWSGEEHMGVQFLFMDPPQREEIQALSRKRA